MLTGRTHSCTNHCAYSQWAAGLASEHIAKLGALIEDLIPTDAEEVHKHQFCNRAQARCGRTYRRTNKSRLGNRCIKHTVATKLLDQPLGDAEYAAPGILVVKTRYCSSARDILAHQNNTRIAAHLYLHGFV